jgi:transportin-1
MAAIEFFNVLLCEVSDPAPALAAPQVIERLVPALMRRLPYSAEDVAAMWDEMQADAQVADREEDIRPHFGMLGKAQGRFGEEDSEEEGEAEAAGGLWTARRRAGKCLENLSGKLAAQVVLPSVVACLERGLSSAAWPQREGALMGLGAVALGCAHGLEPHLPALLPFVVSQTEDAAAPLRRIALWTLGRFARWLCARPHDFFPAALEAVLRRVGDVNKGVQHAAVSALDFLLENSGEARAVDASAARKILDALCGSLQHAQANQLSYTWDSLALAFSTCELRSSAGGDWAARYLPALWNKFAAAASTDPWLASASFAMSKSVAVGVAAAGMGAGWR